MFQKSSDIADALIEPHPLWEYPCKARSDVVVVLQMTYKEFCGLDDSSYSNSVDIPIDR